jgi:class 3 adenylate cyclase
VGLWRENKYDEGIKMPKLRCLYFEDEDDDFETYSIIFERALKPVTDLLIDRAKTPKQAYQKLERHGKNLHVFFADLLINEDATEGLRLVEFVTTTLPHILVIGISKAEGSHPATSQDFRQQAGPDSWFFDKRALKKTSVYSYQRIREEIIAVARRKSYLLPDGDPSSPLSLAAPTTNNFANLVPAHGVDVGAKYIFLDIVEFTKDRPVEAQADVIKQLNAVVSETIKEKHIAVGNRLFLPTGDGLCIVLLSIEHQIDIDIQIALRILERLATYNASTPDETRKFQVRIGIESGEDVLVADINGRQNIAGEGINIASRSMDLADGSQILAGERVYNSLKFRENYPGKFRHYPATVKHGRQLSVYQFIEEGNAGLNLDPPKRLIDLSNTGLGEPNILHGSLVELFGLIEKRIGQVERLRIYANASTSVQPIFANSRVQARRCEMILREPGSDDPDSANFLQHLGHMLKQWDELKRAGRISEFECRRSNMLPTEWQIIFDDTFIICGLNVPDRSDWLGIAEIEPFLVDNSSPEGKFFIDKYVERFDRFFQLTNASPADRQ